MTPERTRVPKYITSDFFTGAYRMTGRMNVGAGGAIGILNDNTRSGAACEDVYISYVVTPASIVAHYNNVRIAKNGLEALLLSRREDMGPAGVARAGYTKIMHYKVMITTEAFEVYGTVEMTGKYDPDTLLFEGAARFFPVYDVTISACVKPDAKYSGEALLINRSKVGAICGGENG